MRRSAKGKVSKVADFREADSHRLTGRTSLRSGVFESPVNSQELTGQPLVHGPRQTNSASIRHPLASMAPCFAGFLTPHLKVRYALERRNFPRIHATFKRRGQAQGDRNCECPAGSRHGRRQGDTHRDQHGQGMGEASKNLCERCGISLQTSNLALQTHRPSNNQIFDSPLRIFHG